MSLFKKKKKRIPDGKYRIIKIGRDALYEFIHESLIENNELFFDVTNTTETVTCFDINWETGEIIFIARQDRGEKENLQFDVDTKRLITRLKNTTDTLYANNRYIEMSEEEIKRL